MKARIWLAVVSVVVTAFVIVAAASYSGEGRRPSTPDAGTPPNGQPQSTGPGTPTESSPSTTTPPPPPPPWRPGSVFANKILVAYYGTYGTSSLGVLGSEPIPEITTRLRRAAAPFGPVSGKKVQIVYELIATIADGFPGADGTYSHDIPRSEVQAYMTAAKKNHALLILDLQPGRSDFLTVAKRYAWALKQPYVGIALDPEWRMGPGDVPGEVIGSVTAAEVNATAAYVGALTKKDRLPQKVFMIHQFVASSIQDIADIKPVRGLAMVQHVDGFGGRQDKLATYHNVARPHQFDIGFKLFYRDDVDMFTPAELMAQVPAVTFVSYQ